MGSSWCHTIWSSSSTNRCRRGFRERGLGVDFGEHCVHVGALVDRIAVVDDRERLEVVAERDGVGHVLPEQLIRDLHDRRRVDPAREARARGHVGDQPSLHRSLEAGAEFGGVGRGVGRERGRPVRLLVHTVGVDHRPRGGGECADAGERGLRLVVVETVEQVVVQPLAVGHRLELGVGQHRLGLRREQHPAARRAGVVERLDAVVVAGEHEALARLPEIEDRQRPHPVEPSEAVGPPLEVGVEHHLGVAVGVERVPERLELRPQLAEVVDLAVVGELHETVVGPHGLVPTGGVDDGEATVPEAGERVLEEALAVGTPMGDAAGHGGQEGGVGRAPEPGNATHEGRSLQGRPPPIGCVSGLERRA